MTKAPKKISNLNFAIFFHSIFPMQKDETRTNVVKNFEVSNSMQMYFSSMIKKEVYQRQRTKERRN
jgi:hypothetical protein